jgi:meso-butanediol dehydrogenase / (S,S)-butanediol dehydrogenase / diacetyl reductase
VTDLKGKVVLVTGGGTGIGGAVARRFVNRGAQVVIVGRRVDVVEQLAREIGALALQCDVGVAESVERTIARLVERCGGLDIVVNNAATVQIGNVEQLDDAAWSSVVEINVNGPMRVARAAIPHLRTRGGGSIVNVSSIGGLFAAKNSAAYGTTKAALLGLTRSLARDYGREGIRVNTLCPGWVDTPMVEPALRMIAGARGISIDAARLVLVEHNPIKRMADPDEIARCVEFLATDAASFVTGAVLIADGGQSIVDLGMLPLTGA